MLPNRRGESLEWKWSARAVAVLVGFLKPVEKGSPISFCVHNTTKIVALRSPGDGPGDVCIIACVTHAIIACQLTGVFKLGDRCGVRNFYCAVKMGVDDGQLLETQVLR